MKDHYKETAFYKSFEPPFITSEDELWKRIETRLHSPKKPTVLLLKRATYAMAAVFLPCRESFFRFYTIQIEVPRGSYQAHLPDGSQ